MEALVREMQIPDTGIPIGDQKIFLTSIPSVFMGKCNLLLIKMPRLCSFFFSLFKYIFEIYIILRRDRFHGPYMLILIRPPISDT